ncbi:MAG TPA: ATP-binding cassette domain-containing protein [Planctomycetota bacterium]|nr:ATP-binding cassette domain-containing protein [Planctomycetota bacterium]
MGFRLEGVGARYDGGPAGSPVLEGVDLRIEAGEALALVGPSGAGKTSLLRILNGTLLAHSGGVHIEGADPATLAPRALRRLRARLGFIHQDHALVPNLRVNQNVAAGRLGHRGFLHGLRSILWTGRSDLTEIHGLLERVGIPETLFLRTDTLSGGQQQRVAIARALFQDPVAILADEPVASVDPARARSIIELLVSVAAERGLTLVVSLHDLSLARDLFPRIVGLRSGQVVFDRPTDDLDETAFADLYQLVGERRRAADSG